LSSLRKADRRLKLMRLMGERSLSLAFHRGRCVRV
jgi:hypothetical protein